MMKAKLRESNKINNAAKSIIISFYLNNNFLNTK